jgi:hypothetical protein
MRTKKPATASGGSLAGEHLSELAFRASSVSAQGTVVSPTRLLYPMLRVTPDAEVNVNGLALSCQPRASIQTKRR